MTIIDNKIRDQLRKPFPPEAISQLPTKSYLSTIKAIYIVERLNDVFGVGGWTIEHEIISDTPEYVTVRGRIVIFEPYNVSTPFQYGGHTKTGTNTEPADGYKSAVTDCQSKCASHLEVGIDVFKGKVNATPGKQKVANLPSSPTKTVQGESKKDNKLSTKQWDFIKKIGADNELTEEEVVILVKWVAEQNNIPPRHWKIAKLMLPTENFIARMKEYNDSMFPVGDGNKPTEGIPND